MVTFLNHLKICQWFPLTIKILSNFQTLFRSTFLNDKHPVVFMKDMEFENLKSLVEYMYKGEANVPQHMLSAFIKDAESLQIRGLAECASELNAIQEPSGTSSLHPKPQKVPVVSLGCSCRRPRSGWYSGRSTSKNGRGRSLGRTHQHV
jgi:hypothetical protein